MVIILKFTQSIGFTSCLFLDTVTASELQHAENKIDELQKWNEHLKKKYNKREGFLKEMETIFRAMKVRCDGLEESIQMQQVSNRL